MAWVSRRASSVRPCQTLVPESLLCESPLLDGQLAAKLLLRFILFIIVDMEHPREAFLLELRPTGALYETVALQLTRPSDRPATDTGVAPCTGTSVFAGGDVSFCHLSPLAHVQTKNSKAFMWSLIGTELLSYLGLKCCRVGWLIRAGA